MIKVYFSHIDLLSHLIKYFSERSSVTLKYFREENSDEVRNLKSTVEVLRCRHFSV